MCAENIYKHAIIKGLVPTQHILNLYSTRLLLGILNKIYYLNHMMLLQFCLKMLKLNNNILSPPKKTKKLSRRTPSQSTTVSGGNPPTSTPGASIPQASVQRTKS
ncbi:hypothetical protein Salat_2498500 [Sesamum alatum]|uniref:Uncharacterized protein n=1 Tax=Sesamum alatum TaxID=300844 RepID=A0AAE1XRI3_9LAMI|nr:hypothetical protein Salat_2498500 [Sesamum alatum]